MPLVHDLRFVIPTKVRERGRDIYLMREVTITSGSDFEVSAKVRGSTTYAVGIERMADNLLASCECPYFDTEGICKHIWATIMLADEKHYLQGERGRPARKLTPDWQGSDGNFELHAPVAPKAPVPISRWREAIDKLKSPLHAMAVPAPAAWREDREIWYILALTDSQWDQSINVEVMHREPKKDGTWGKLKSARVPRHAIANIVTPADSELLSMLGGSSMTHDWGNRESIPSGFHLDIANAPRLLEKMCATGRCRLRTRLDEHLETMPELAWDGGPPWQFRLRMDRDDQHWVVSGEFYRPDDQRLPLNTITFLHPSGLVLASETFARFTGTGAAPWANLLRRSGNIVVPESEAQDFQLTLLRNPDLPDIVWPEELRLSRIRPNPRAIIRISTAASGKRNEADALYGTVYFEYESHLIPSSDRSRTMHDVARKVLIERHSEFEAERLRQLTELGFRRERSPYHHDEEQFHLRKSKFGVAIRQLVSTAWGVEFDGKAFRNSTGFEAELTSGIDWFELHAAVDFDGIKADAGRILKAIRQKSSIVELPDGSWGLLPDELIEQYGGLLEAGELTRDHVRYSKTQTSLLDALLASRPAVQVDAFFATARERLRNFDRIAPAPQPPGFTGELRHYQAEGVAWMRFLQELGFGGCLADDMGLGKTAQALAVLEQRRELRAAGENIGPSLAVVPRSIIFNWKQEAARFTPNLRVLDHSGAERNRDASGFQDHDLILTTYGTLRRDIAILQDYQFDYVILDEAQAIKNASSDSAKAARLLRANHRLAMSGTPVENHIGELYSLFEFLNPGMLTTAKALSSVTGGSARNPDEATRDMLAIAVRPFMLRRTKDQVATELPDRIEQTIYCELDTAERKIYDGLRDSYRAVLLGRVEKDGIAKSQMYILEALLRLRQAACHPGLLEEKAANAGSTKLDTLIERLAEVLDEGHKAIVFSQFTSLLAILRKHLDLEKVMYEYLDGRTRDRQSRVENFQTNPECKLFLISLKAGGVGLNLTAAEYVFLLDPWWNPAVEAQAIDRAHRIGQSRHVFAYRLIAKDTVEEKVLELQNRKRQLADSIIKADASLVSDLKREDLEFLLS